MTTSDRRAAAVLFLKLEPTWVMVDDIRQLVAAFCATTCGGERQDQLALAAHELVQNAIAHAASPDIELELSLDRAGDRAVVSVTNRARPDAIAALRARLARTVAHGSALDGYLAAMRDNPHARGGLGLARIRYEAALELALDIEGDRVTVRAAGPLAAPRLERYRAAAAPELVVA